MSEFRFLDAVGRLDADLVAEHLTLRASLRPRSRRGRAARMTAVAASLLLVCAAVLSVVGALLLPREGDYQLSADGELQGRILFVAAVICLIVAAVLVLISRRRRR